MRSEKGERGRKKGWGGCRRRRRKKVRENEEQERQREMRYLIMDEQRSLLWAFR